MNVDRHTLDFNQISTTADGHHIGTIKSSPMPFALSEVTFSILNDTSGGRFRIVTASVFELELGPNGKPVDITLTDESDGSTPVSVTKGGLLEVKVEYVPETSLFAADAFSATLRINGKRFGPVRRDVTDIHLLASRLRKILIVLDGRFTVQNGRPIGDHYASFGPGDLTQIDDPHADDYFGLSEVLWTLHDSLPLFKVVKAHRDKDPIDFTRQTIERFRLPKLSPAAEALFRPDFEQFKFDQHNLNEFDQMWLFGVGGPAETDPLSENELIAIARFMDAGGGVFATGDHGSLGLPLCGRVLRVRSMRKWNFPSPGPDGEPVAPPMTPADRRDSTQPGHHPIHGIPDFAFSNQSDDIPQPIEATPAGLTHPLLKLQNGRTLSVLPDHMHEGEVIDPFDAQFHFTPTVTYKKGLPGEQKFIEYPARNGLQPRPQILASGTVLGGHATPSFERAHEGSASGDATESRKFGVICAYDGHQAGVGRVCVDSTWHHFFDINLIGDPVGKSEDSAVPPQIIPDLIKRRGFSATPQGLAHLADIKTYYRNIATWLVRARA